MFLKKIATHTNAKAIFMRKGKRLAKVKSQELYENSSHGEGDVYIQ
jgi:hypothetical protein